MNLSTRNTKQALSYPFYFIQTLGLTLAGIGNCIYLLLTHYWNYTSISYASFCALSKAINCDTVSQSSWSIILNLPVALWGLLGYLLFFIFLVPTRHNTKKYQSLWGILFILALIFCISAVYLGYISATKIHSYCIMCLLSYTISFVLLFYCWIIRRRFCQTSIIADVKKSAALIRENWFLKLSLLTVFVCAISLQLFLPRYWQFQSPTPNDSIPSGITENGNPWIGAKNPTLTIEEYTDYQCFQCAKMHHHLRMLVAEHPDKVRLIHRNYPMDNEVNPAVVPEPFHVGSGRLALLSIAAQKQNKFWQVNDAIFETIRERKTNINIREIAQKAQADPVALSKSIYAKDTIEKLEDDVRSGLHHNITGTPSYVVNGEVYLGNLPASFAERF